MTERELYYKKRLRDIKRGYTNADMEILKLKISSGTDPTPLPIREQRAFRALSSEEYQRLIEATP